MNLRQQLIQEIERIPESLIEEILEFVELTKKKKQLTEMANDCDIQQELKAIDDEFAITEMDGLTDNEY